MGLLKDIKAVIYTRKMCKALIKILKQNSYATKSDIINSVSNP